MAILSSEFIISRSQNHRNVYLKRLLEMPCLASFSKQDYHQDFIRSTMPFSIQSMKNSIDIFFVQPLWATLYSDELSVK